MERTRVEIIRSAFRYWYTLLHVMLQTPSPMSRQLLLFRTNLTPMCSLHASAFIKTFSVVRQYVYAQAVALSDRGRNRLSADAAGVVVRPSGHGSIRVPSR
jgi:hypothetical protein